MKDAVDLLNDRIATLKARNAALVEALKYIRQNTDCSVARQWAAKALKSVDPLENNARKSVDLSVLIDSDIDCFDYDGKIVQFGGPRVVVDALVDYKIVPRMNYWFCGHNFEDPSPLIDKLERAGFEVQGDIEDNFIITGLLDGYRWPWERE